MSWFSDIFKKPEKQIAIAHQHAEGGLRVVDPLVGPSLPGTTQGADDQPKGNVFTNYEAIVTAIYRRYLNLETFGCGPTRTIIDWRATQIAGNGANITSNDPKTKAFLRKFIADNNLNGARFWRFVRDGEMEGKSLIRAFWTKDKIKVRNIPWYRWRFKVEFDAEDEDLFLQASYKDGEKHDVIYKADRAVYVRLGGSNVTEDANITNGTIPRVGAVLWRVDNLDRAIVDLRSNNHLFGYPKLVIEAKDLNEARDQRKTFFSSQRTIPGGPSTQTDTLKIQTNIGEFYIVAGSMKFAEPSGNAIKALMDEVTLDAQIVSGETGIPVHYLGFPDLMSNRSTAADMHEMVAGSTAFEREAWKEGLRQLCIIACNMDSEKSGKKYDLESIEVSIPVVMQSQVAQVAEVYMPLQQNGTISQQTLRERIPGVDPELEEERIAEEKESSGTEADKLATDIMSRMNANNASNPSGPKLVEGAA